MKINKESVKKGIKNAAKAPAFAAAAVGYASVQAVENMKSSKKPIVKGSMQELKDAFFEK